MALSNEWVNDLATDCFTDDCAVRKATGMIREVESEVRKQDDALIRNFVAAIKLDRHDWEDWPEDSRKAFEALRARLEGKP